MCFQEYFPSGTQYLVFNIFDKYRIFTRSLNKHIHLLACTRFKMHSDGNVFKIIGVCFRFKYLMTKRVFLQLLNNVFLTKILVNAPLKTF